MKNSLKFSISNYELISETNGQQLVGGFSSSFNYSVNELEAGANNCDGGNCRAECGTGQNIQCNTVAGCGM